MMSTVALLVAFCSISAFFFTSHIISHQPKLRWIPESAVVILFGLLTVLVTGLILRSEYSSSFNTELFFKILLPPIIFASGFKVDLEVFYQNISTILVYANLGTIINTLVFGAAIYGVGKWNLTTGLTLTESMSFGSVISATDPVTTIAIFDHLQVEPALYVIVVGVSILDDAVSIIMFDLFNSFLTEGNEARHSIGYYLATSVGQFVTIFAGSVAVGCAVGLFFAALMKQCKGILSNSVQFHMLTLCAVYISYLTADSMRLSGITTVMFAGVATQRYLKMFADEQCVTAVTHAISLAAQLFETVVFFMIGYSLLQNTSSRGSDGVFVLWSLLLTFISRAAQIYPLAFFLNAYNRPLSSVQPNKGEAQSLSWGYQHVMMVAGLRGPISYATSKLFPDTFGHNNLVAVATSVVILATIIVLGPLTVPMLRTFKVPFGSQLDNGTDTAGCDTASESSLGLEMMSDLSQHSVEEGSFHQQTASQTRKSDHDAITYSALEKSGAERTGRSWSSIVCSVVHCTAVVQWVERVERKYVVEYFEAKDPFAPVAESEEHMSALNTCKHCEAVSRSRHSVSRITPSSEYIVVNSTDNALIRDATAEDDEFATGDVIYSHFSHPGDKSNIKGGFDNSPTIAVKSVGDSASHKSLSVSADGSSPEDRVSKRRRDQDEDVSRILSIVREGIDLNLNGKEMV